MLAPTRAQQQCKPQRRATAAGTWHADTRACAHKSLAPMHATKASNRCEHIASSQTALAPTGAQHQCKLRKQATPASPPQATDLYLLPQDLSPKARHKGKQQLRARSEQQTVLPRMEPSTNASHKGKQQLRAKRKQQTALAHMEPNINASHTGKQQLLDKSRQQTALAHKEPSTMQATKASTSCERRACSKLLRLTSSPAPMQATKASYGCEHNASSKLCWLT